MKIFRKKQKKMIAVKRCLICLKKAEYFSGHLITETNEEIIAGFCKKHFCSNINICSYDFLNIQGCFGAYHSKYGIQYFKSVHRKKEISIDDKKRLGM